MMENTDNKKFEQLSEHGAAAGIALEKSLLLLKKEADQLQSTAFGLILEAARPTSRLVQGIITILEGSRVIVEETAETVRGLRRAAEVARKVIKEEKDVTQCASFEWTWGKK